MEFSSVSITILVILVSSLSAYLLLFRRKVSGHGFKTVPLLGALPDFLRNRHRFLDWVTETVADTPGNTAAFTIPGNTQGIVTANPQVVEYILKTNFEDYPKGSYFISALHDLLGSGIFNVDGDSWKVQRKTASYEFNTKSLRNFVMECVASELESRLIPLIESAAKSGNVLDLQDILERFAFDNICRLSFNVDPGCLEGDSSVGAEFMRAFDEAALLSSGRFLSAFSFLVTTKKFLDVGSEKKLRKSVATVHDFADKIIRKRMEEKRETVIKEDEDLLSRFITQKEASPQYLRDIVISFILAGRDTTSAALTWFFWLLSTHPHVEQKILQELAEIRSRNRKPVGEVYTFDELRDMHYLQASITESMRLYPPVPADSKTCAKDDILPDGTVIRKGWFVTYFAYSMGRMENIWGKDCREYKPERWIENGVFKQESSFKFPVFHAGPRICLGKDMAYIQMKSIAASVLERFALNVLVEKGKSPEGLLSLTLRVKGGLQVTVKEREAPSSF